MTDQVSLVVINFGTPALVRRLLDSLREHRDAALLVDVVVVDNGFPQRGDVRTSIRPADYAFPVRVVQNEATSYASGVNRGASACAGPLIAVANSDLEWPSEGGIGPLVTALGEDRTASIAGPQLLYPDGAWQRSFGRFPSLSEGLRALLLLDVVRGGLASLAHDRASRGRRRRSVDYVDGAFMLVRRECFLALGGFDETFAFYGEDADFCWRAARAGWRCLFVPTARLVHIRGASSTAVASVEYLQKLLLAKRAFVARHFGAVQARWYGRLQRLGAWEVAVAYTVLATALRSSAWRKRATLARHTAQAAAVLRGSPAPPG